MHTHFYLRHPLRYIAALLAGLLTTAFSLTACAQEADSQITVGAERTEAYLPLLKGKRIGLLSNHTGVLSDGTHVLDAMLAEGLDVRVLFSPEHGFRGTADAGEHVASGIDGPSGLPIASLYDGKRRGPAPEVMDSIDVVVCDLQDVGLRFYTYYATMLEMMQAAARTGKEFVVLDRPNPNGMYVDGPLLDMSLASGVGRLPIPVVHGMTLGELARMIVGEGWLGEGMPDLTLHVVPCAGYTHASRYRLPVAPSPNLPTMQAVYLYPSTCLFEGTVASLGRGTDYPFEVYGHPDYRGKEPFTFTPESRPGAKKPPLMGKLCRGRDLRSLNPDTIIAGGIDLSYIIDAYRNTKTVDGKFFTSFFDKLIGRRDIRPMIERGLSADEIKRTWADDVKEFRAQRAPYLIYPES